MKLIKLKWGLINLKMLLIQLHFNKEYFQLINPIYSHFEIRKVCSVK